MAATCLYPHRHPVTGQFCRTLGAVKVPDLPHAYCPHHIGVARAAAAPLAPHPTGCACPSCTVPVADVLADLIHAPVGAPA